MKVIKKLKEIYSGWSNYAFPNPNIEILAKKRALICAECINNINSKCEICHCPLAQKTRSEYSECPIKRW